jgi:hypothetical protein
MLKAREGGFQSDKSAYTLTMGSIETSTATRGGFQLGKSAYTLTMGST